MKNCLIVRWCFLWCLVCGMVAASATPPAEGADDGWSTIKGQIVWGGGDVPARKPLNVDKDKDHCLEKGPVLDDDWVINKDNKGIRWTFVWMAPEPGGSKTLPIHPSLKEIKEKTVTLDQPCCAFVPHCLAVRVGQEVAVKNSAPIPHNVNWGGIANTGANQLLPPKTELVLKDLKAEKLPMRVACNIHGWMRARIGVFDHPYFAITDENGNFEIKLAPAGNYRLKVYHESVGWRGGAAGRDGDKVTVKSGEVTDLGKIDLKPKYDD